MDAGTITIICAVLGSSALTTVIQAIVGTAQKKKTQADSQGDHLAEIDKKLGKMQEHQDEQYRNSPPDHHVGRNANGRASDRRREV